MHMTQIFGRLHAVKKDIHFSWTSCTDTEAQYEKVIKSQSIFKTYIRIAQKHIDYFASKS